VNYDDPAPEPKGSLLSTGSQLRCIECRTTWRDRTRWRGYMTDDESPDVVFYCTDCAEREFGVR
jgi:hypothetical protein